jgi:tetratricopeptide (TPR) repeat protein
MTKKNSREMEYDRLCKGKKWEEARTILLNWLRDDPHNHWVLTNIGETYYEEKNYNKALEYEEQARREQSNCPLVLWDMIEALFALGRDEHAFQICKTIIHRGANRIAYGECGEGIRWARSLVNDCQYILGLIYASRDDFALASKYIKTHISKRNRNCVSIYNLREVKKDLAKILEGKDPRAENTN